MPPADLARVDAVLDLLDVGLGDHAWPGSDAVGQPALDVGQEDHLVRAQRSRDGARRLVGVDVVGAPLDVGAHRCDHGDVVLGDVVQHVDVDALDGAHEAEVELVAVGTGHTPLRDLEQPAVVAAQPDRRLPVAVEVQHDVLVELADQHHLRDLDRLLVGHAQALHELDLEPEPLHVVGDLGPAAVHDHGVHARRT